MKPSHSIWSLLGLALLAATVSPSIATENAATADAELFQGYVSWLADDAREGRGLGTKGLDAAAHWLAEQMRQAGLEPGHGDSFLQPMELVVGIEVGDGAALSINGSLLAADAWSPTSFSAVSEVVGPTVSVGHGIVAPDLGIDDYEGLDVEGKIVVARRFVPDNEAFEDPEVERRMSDLHFKAFLARERGARALVVVDAEAELPTLGGAGAGDAGIPVAVARGEAAAELFESSAELRLRVVLERRTTEAFNVVGRVPAGAAERLAGVVVVGAHYDHLGYGGSNSRDAGKDVIHNGADDNASGTAALLLVARRLVAARQQLSRDVYVVAFTGEESGVLGSDYFTHSPPPGLRMEDVVAMLNMDMVGRLRDEKVDIMGARSADEWEAILEPLCRQATLDCSAGGSGYGPSDHSPFYVAGAPVLHFFTGTHEDYHTSTDDADKINAPGGARVAALVAETARTVAARPGRLTFRKVADPVPRGDLRSRGASLGTIPNYDPSDETPGVLLSDVRPDGPAANGGLQGGDRIVGIGDTEIHNINDMMFVLGAANPGDRTVVTVLRDGERLDFEVVLGTPRRRR